MSGFNPFAPQMDQKQQPQFQGVQAPNVAMQTQPSLMQTIGPAVAQQAMGSDMAGNVANSVVDTGVQGAKDVWGALTKSPQSPSTIPVSELSNTMGTAVSPSGMFGGAEGAMAAQQAATAATNSSLATGIAGGAEAALATQALAAPVATTVASTVAPAVAAGTGAAAAAPMALAAGPFAPLVLGGMMLAANSGK